MAGFTLTDTDRIEERNRLERAAQARQQHDLLRHLWATEANLTLLRERQGSVWTVEQRAAIENLLGTIEVARAQFEERQHD